MMMNKQYQDAAVEALILASPEPLPARKVTQVLNDLTPSVVAKTVTRLNERYAEVGVSIRIRELAGGFQHYIIPEFVGYVEELFARRRKLRLTRAALETAAIVAYRQPVTKGEIEHIRGVASDGVLQNLLEKNIVKISGRAATVGRPLQYGTTDEFLKFFGLNSMEDLPKMSEIEELISAHQAQDMDQLELNTAIPSTEPLKLNIADGTFNPAERQEQIEGELDQADSKTKLDESNLSEPIAVEEATGKLILKSGNEETDSDTGVADAANERVEEETEVEEERVEVNSDEVTDRVEEPTEEPIHES